MARWVTMLALAACVGGVLGFGGASAADAGQEAVPHETLYAKLGGVYEIAALVDDLVERLKADEVLVANPYLAEALERVPAAGLKFQVTSMLCAATGGPESYHGRSMKDAHAHLRIGEREWQAFLAALSGALSAADMEESAADELLRIVEGERDSIVTVTEDPADESASQ